MEYFVNYETKIQIYFNFNIEIPIQIFLNRLPTIIFLLLPIISIKKKHEVLVIVKLNHRIVHDYIKLNKLFRCVCIPYCNNYLRNIVKKLILKNTYSNIYFFCCSLIIFLTFKKIKREYLYAFLRNISIIFEVFEENINPDYILNFFIPLSSVV